MDGESEEQGRPKFEIVTPAGRSRSSREYTGPGISTYVLEEDGAIERFCGEYAGGIRQGAGEYEFADGSHFKGSYENNKKHGVGDAIYKKKETVEGETHEIGEARYLGHFRGGQRESYGCMVYPNGDMYKGEWLAGRKHGEGAYYFSADGSVLSGEWAGGNLKRGRWRLPTGAVYVGDFALNKPTGQGTWILPGGMQVLVKYTQEKKETANSAANEDDKAEEEEGVEKYEIEKVTMQCICNVKTRE